MEVPSELEWMARHDDPARLRVEVRPLFTPVPPALVTGAAAMTVGCAMLSTLLASVMPSEPHSLVVTIGLGAVSLFGMVQVLWAAHRSSAWLELQVAPHQLRLIRRSALLRPQVHTVALGDLLGAEVIGDEIVLRTRSGVRRIPFPARGQPTREGVDRLLHGVERRCHTFGSPEEVPSSLNRVVRTAR